MAECNRLTQLEKKDYLFAKFTSFKVTVTRKKSWKFIILVGSGDDMHIVCRKGFCRVYTISHWYLDDIIQRMKMGDVNCLGNLNHNTRITKELVNDKRLDDFAENFGITLTQEQRGSLRMQSSVPALIAASWMQYYFSLCGDQCPDTDSEIHLEPIPKKEVYKEYKFDMEATDETQYSLKIFLQLWKDCFPYVKVRKYKQSCGHCNICSELAGKRRDFRDKYGRQEV
jgi:hypothetical protein